ncbi:hypothetical protein [Bacillus sp. T33-2]|uniref:hypothetical protein n=1 Tax=Bacillus sp. T33-2 TaxID=2054168 RepID=UPI000C783E94|nr:hypothetical protein [Bacillus sp. T33-2]PLR97571.1 hypothetical protein CVD19_08820 [Bacillus sp. T33-2]
MKLSSYLNYQLKSYIRSYRFIPPVTVFLGWVFILYAYKHVPILSSYAVSSIVLYLMMTWIAMSVFSLEDDSEKHILFSHLGQKTKFLFGKWLICLIWLAALFLFAELFPIVTNSFKGEMTGVHLGLSFYSHLAIGIYGILVGTFFAVATFASRRYAWLAAMLVLMVSLASESLAEALPLVKWILWLFPPVVKVIAWLGEGDVVHLEGAFWNDALISIAYIIIGAIVVMWSFKRKEQ